jgi:hypothetical protein
MTEPARSGALPISVTWMTSETESIRCRRTTRPATTPGPAECAERGGFSDDASEKQPAYARVPDPFARGGSHDVQTTSRVTWPRLQQSQKLTAVTAIATRRDTGEEVAAA